MLELLLNLLWAVISAIAVAGLLQTRRYQFERKQLLPLGALLCAAVILFPSISVSDDIHSEPFIVEDSRSIRHVAGAKTPGGIVPLLWLACACWLLLFDPRRRQTLLSIDTSNPFLHASPLLRNALGRAPPRALSLLRAGV